jgi:hypothetical protein
MDSDVIERQELTCVSPEGGIGGAVGNNDVGVDVSTAINVDGVDGYISRLDNDGNIEQVRSRLAFTI